MNWLEISLTVDGELAEAVADVLARFAPNGVMTEQGIKFLNDEDHGTPAGPIIVRAYLEMDEHIEETRQKLEESLFYLGMIQPIPVPVYKQIADQNWMEAWKQHYKPIPIGERLIIVPLWLDSPEPERIPIKIDPGMAFGTGTHPTTQLSLELIEAWFRQSKNPMPPNGTVSPLVLYLRLTKAAILPTSFPRSSVSIHRMASPKRKALFFWGSNTALMS